jgi:hypothetical protein
VTLYQNGSAAQKMWMLTALFTGGTQTELAVLEQSEFDLDAGALIHFRNKTSIEGRFWLPAELVTLLRAEFKKHEDKPLAFYTESGGTAGRTEFQIPAEVRCGLRDPSRGRIDGSSCAIPRSQNRACPKLHNQPRL